MEKKKIALITGITGQDGSFLAELLLEKNYEVHGTLRRCSVYNTQRIEHLYFDEWIKDMSSNPSIHLHYADLSDASSLIKIITKIKPDEIYNLAAQSHVKVSFDCPEYTADVDGVGVLRLLEAVRLISTEKQIKIYQASTSELFGLVQEVPQKETTPFYPRSPYAAAKLYGYWIIKNYREAYNIYATNGILFNHESERRGQNFVTRKITLSCARIVQGYQEKLYLGNINSKRDWGYAKDYVECMWLMLQQDKPEDYIIATGQFHSVREFCELTFKFVGINLKWQGKDSDEKGICESVDKSVNPDIKEDFIGKVLVEIDPKYYRPTEVDQLLGDPSKAKKQLGWNPNKTSFNDLVKIMINADMQYVRENKGNVKI